MKRSILLSLQAHLTATSNWHDFLKITVILFSLTFLKTNAVMGQSNCSCTTQYIELNSGKNQHLGLASFYNVGQRDEFWGVTQGPSGEGPYPRCPFVVTNFNGTAGSLSMNPSLQADGNLDPPQHDSYDDVPYVFERKFQVCTNSITPIPANLHIAYFYGDLHITSIRLVGPGGYNNLIDASWWLQQNNNVNWNIPFNAIDGVYSLRFELGNDRSNTGSGLIPNWNGKSGMSFEFAGYVQSTNGSAIFTDNKHFGRNVLSAATPNYCAPAYPPSTAFTLTGNTCISNGSTTITISDFHNASGENTYTITGPGSPTFTNINQTANTANTTLGVGTYTITATDALSCTKSSIVKIGNPTLTSTASPQCLNLGQTSTFTCASTGGNGLHQYKLNTGAYSFLNTFTNNSLVNNQLTTYTLTVKDANGCTATTLQHIGPSQYPVSLGVYPQVCPNVPINSTLTASTYSMSPPPTYTFTGPTAPTGQVNNTAFANSMGVYTVMVTDAAGCTSSATTVLSNADAPIITFENGVTNPETVTICLGESFTIPGQIVDPNTILSILWSPATGLSSSTISNPIATPTTSTTYTVVVTNTYGCTVTATQTINVNPNVPPTPIISLSEPCIKQVDGVTVSVLNPLGAQFMYTLVPNTSPVLQASPNLVVPVNNTYTVTVIDVTNNYCSATTTFVMPKCCERVPLVGPNSDPIWIPANTTASVFLGSGNQLPIGNTSIVFEGNFTVDQNMDILNIPNVYFAQGAQVNLTNGSTFTVDNSTLKSCGLAMWNGIKADQSNEQINVVNNSQITEAIDAITIDNNAKLIAQDSEYLLNGNCGMKISNCTFSPNVVVTNNRFFSPGTLLLPPYTGTLTQAGIVAIDNLSLRIGAFSNSNGPSNLGNTFDHLKQGISCTINPTFFNYFAHLYLNENEFSHIKSALPSDITKIQQRFTQPDGACIWVSNLLNSCNMNVHVNNYNNNPNNKIFEESDKGIVALNSNIHQKDLRMRNILAGTLLSSSNGRLAHIYLSKYEHVFQGVELTGTANHTFKIDNNTIKTSGPILLNPSLAIWPVGIHVNQFTNAVVLKNLPLNTIDKNNIDITAAGGIGIKGANWNNRVQSHDNIIYFTTTSNISETSFSDLGIFTRPQLFGIWLQNGLNSDLQLNAVTGSSNNTVFNARKSNGIYIDNSPGLYLRCNYMRNTRYGFRVIGNCITSKYTAANSFHNHWEGMLFSFAGTGLTGTLGNIGSASPALDLNNTWTGNYLSDFNNITQSMQLSKVRRVSNGNGSAANIFTSNGSINNAQSFPDQFSLGLRYAITPLSGNFSIFPSCKSPIVSAVATALFMPSIEQALETVNQTTAFLANEESEQFRQEYMLYEALDKDESLRQLNPDFQEFYDDRIASSIDQVYRINNAIAGLEDSVYSEDSVALAAKITEITTLNADINFAEQYVNYERQINDVYIKYLLFGLDSISHTDSIFVDSLAYACPLYAGNAVYKARVLYELRNPVKYWQDQTICAASLLNKGLSNVNEENMGDQNSRFVNLEEVELTISSEVLSIAPNPTQGNINIRYQLLDNQTAKLLIYDLTGRLMKTIPLDTDKQQTGASLFDLKNGIYTYLYQIDGVNKQGGKITLLK